jgi:SAM-dependent methyltransferase
VQLEELWPSPDLRERWRRLLRLLRPRPGDRVLDVGAGRGDAVRFAAARVGPTGLAVGVEHGQGGLGRLAEGLLAGGRSFQGTAADAVALPFRDAAFDAVLCVNVLEAVPDRARVLAEVPIIKGLFADGPLTFGGRYYAIEGLDLRPKPAQRPHPPILIGGAGRRLLSVAAREADIVALVPGPTPAGEIDWAGSGTAAATDEKLAWVRAAAGARADALELSTLVFDVAVTPDRRRVAAERGAEMGLSPEQVLGSPHVLIGMVEQMAEDLRERRERHGISYAVVYEPVMDAFAPVVARLAGT